MSLWSELGSDIHRTYFVLSIFAAVFAFFLAISVAGRAIKRRNLMTTFVFLDILLLAIALILDPLYLGYRAATGIDLITRQGILSFGFTGFANIFLILFLHNVFFNKTPLWKFIPLMVLEALILPLGLLMYNAGQDALPILGIHLILSIIIYSIQFITAFLLRRRIRQDNPNDFVGFYGTTYIGIAGLFLLLTYTTFIFQELRVMFMDQYIAWGIIQNDATIFIPLGFIFSGISAFCIYIGFMVPEWLRKRFPQTLAKKI